MGARAKARAGAVWVYRRERETGKVREPVSLKKPKNIFIFKFYLF